MGWRDWLRPGPLRDRLGTAGVQTVAALSAAVVVLIGAAPMAAASADPNADPIIAQAIAGDTPPVNLPAPGFRLVDQDGTAVSLASLRGKVVLMTFLDPVCTSDCPLIAQEFKDAWRLLGAQSRQVELVAVVANQTYLSTEFTRAFDKQEGLTTVRDWLYLTGTLPQLKKVWDDYGVTVENLPAGAMSAHDDIAVVIDRAGRIRYELSSDPGPGTTSSRSSFGVLLAGYARQELASS
jgi:cytochrome oxidase Cu insertion factor (SCO1/SenC/PrrC family)